MPSIRQNAYPDVLPDFRNLAVMARVLVAMNALALAGAFYATSALAPALERFMYAAAFLEPLLLVELIVLFAAAALLARLPYWLGCLAVVSHDAPKVVVRWQARPLPVAVAPAPPLRQPSGMTPNTVSLFRA